MKISAALSADEIHRGYMLLLGRPPETQQVIDFYVASGITVEGFYKKLLAAPEFAMHNGMIATATMINGQYYQAPARVDHEVSPDVLHQMLARIRGQWTVLGEQDPHWSVLSHEDYRADAMDELALERFQGSGRLSADLVDRFAARTGREAKKGVCLELGCGVGRITRYLADRFDTVIGVDISPGNLALCRSYMAQTNIENVDLVQVSGIEDFDDLPSFDYLYSIIVLQHNPPPIQLVILRKLFSKLNAGGGVLFQIPSSMPGYSFDADVYLETKHGEMEMHGLPRHVVFAEMQANDIEIVDMVPDTFAGGMGSFTYYGIKRG